MSLKSYFQKIPVLIIIFFSCNKEESIPAHFTDMRDGQAYKQIIVGGTTWMSEDLRYKTPPYSYQQGLSVCPQGWSLPTHDDWAKLANAYGGYDTYNVEIGDGAKAYKALKPAGSSGFNGFDRYWTHTPAWIDSPYIRSFCFSIHENEKKVKLVGNPFDSKFNCRCVKGEKEIPNGSYVEIKVDGMPAKYEEFPMYYPDEINTGRVALFLYKQLKEDELTNRILIGMEIPPGEVDTENPFLLKQSSVNIQISKEGSYKAISIQNSLQNTSETHEMKVLYFNGERIEGEFSGIAYSGEVVEGTFRIYLPKD